jgi:hypothetical protein
VKETHEMTGTNIAEVPRAPKPPVESGNAISAIVPRNVDEAYRLAQALAVSDGMIPSAYRGKPNEVMAAILHGMEIGLPPMQAVRQIAVINGRSALWGDALPALVQRAGHHVDVEIEGDGQDAVAVATLTRGDTGKQIVRRFSMADAKRAGLAGKQGPWQQYPLRMIAMRARAFAIRDGAADALMGLAIADEVSDYGPDAARDVTPKRAAPAPGRVVYADPAPEPQRDEIIEAETVPFDPPPSADEIEAATESALADAQARNALFDIPGDERG